MSLQYQLTQACIQNTAKNNATVKTVKLACRKFASWCKENDFNKLSKIERYGAREVLQEYCDFLIDRKLSASTIHTYLYAPCKALNINMAEIDKPKRMAETITRSRDVSKNYIGRLQLDDDKYKRLIDFQRVTGLRRSELSKLKGCNLKYDESNHLCIEVGRGKGGKYQLQRILSCDTNIVLDTFKDIKDSEFVFSSTELRNKIDLHALRAESARKAYSYYESMSISEKKILVEEMCERYLAFHPNLTRDSIEFKKWFNQLRLGNGLYTLRGSNYDRAIMNNRATRYNRIALMAVSIFHLSHWRLDVTVKNYMI